MKPRLAEFLVCPLDRTALDLREWESSPKTLTASDDVRIKRLGLDRKLFAREIVTGVLVNPAGKIFYPIHNGVPRMLVFPTEIMRSFAAQHAVRLARELPGFTLPTGRGMPGEETVLRTFSSEWTNLEWNGDAYWSVTPEVLYDNMRFLLDLAEKPVRDKLVLEVGIGIGGIADYVASKEGAELVGVDLSYAVEPAYGLFGTRNPFLHIIQASAFALPLREGIFDLVYSQGVLHHTHDTRLAFERVSRMPKPGGRFYVWVYSPTSEQRTPVRRLLMLIENAVRPLVWMLPQRLQTLVLLPVLPFYIVHQNVFIARNHPDFAKYGWSEALHAARDRLTPRFVHWHSEDELCTWFQQAGYRNLQRTSQRKTPDFILKSLIVATSVEGTRQAGPLPG